MIAIFIKAISETEIMLEGHDSGDLDNSARRSRRPLDDAMTADAAAERSSDHNEKETSAKRK